ncbi:MAG: hypothetical protein V4473_01420 [Patescibacteria group bacterium]
MKKLVYAALSFAPVMAFAAADLSGISALIDSLKVIVNKIIPLLFGVAIIYFFWGLITYIRSAGDPKKADEGKSIMIWGVIALFVMVAIYGLLNWLAGATGITPGATPPAIPQI